MLGDSVAPRGRTFAAGSTPRAGTPISVTRACGTAQARGMLAPRAAGTEDTDALARRQRRGRGDDVRERRMRTAEHALADLVDLDRLQRACDSFAATGDIGLFVLDPGGTILVAAGWQDICTQVHRAHEDTLTGCLESDARINQRLVDGLDAPEHYAYQCANGLWDVAFPLIIAGEHLGNVFTGQFFYDDDEIDEAAFRQRAQRLGFDEAAYLEALARVPKLSHEHVAQTVSFLADFVGMLADLGLAVLRRDQDRATLRESEERYRGLTEDMPVFISAFLPDGTLTYANTALAAMAGSTVEAMIGRSLFTMLGRDDVEVV